MKTYDITLITAEDYHQPENPNWYVQQVLNEDGLVRAALEDLGLKVAREPWSGNFDWSSTRFAIFRTPWDYSKRYQEFSMWLERVKYQTHLINSTSLIDWNIDKNYLKDLKDRGVHIPPTHYINKGTLTSLSILQQKLGWEEMVLKPTVSAGGRHTYRLRVGNLEDYEVVFQKLIAQEDMMLQPFLKNIVSKGEIALMAVGNKVTHAVLKKAKEGDFRVQDDFGGSVHEYTASEEQIEFAQKVIKACPEQPVYSRIDLVWDNNDALALSELEIFEPEMWYRFHPKGAVDLAAEMIAYMQKTV